MSDRLKLISTFGWFGGGTLEHDLLSVSTFGWFGTFVTGVATKLPTTLRALFSEATLTRKCP